MRKKIFSAAALALALVGVAACEKPAPAPAHGAPQELVGLFTFVPGGEADGKAVGTWFQMLTPTGGLMPNNNSKIVGHDKDGKAVPGAYTLLQPGDAGGLRAEGYQSVPTPAFAGTKTDPNAGDSLASSVTVPTLFFNVKFSISTNPTDPQTKRPVSPPRVFLKDGKLTADVSSWAATWNGQYFNQGAPKPKPANDAEVQGVAQVKHVYDWAAQKFFDVPVADNVPQGDWATGTYDPTTRHYTLDWRSLIVSGPFDKFTGVWHLEGVFEPADNPTAAPSS